MKSYPALHRSMGLHTIRTTLQYKQWSGSFTYKMGGNCKGWGLISSTPFDTFDDDDLANWQYDNLVISYDDDTDEFVVCFAPNSKDEITLYLSQFELECLIVKIEIIDFEEGERL